jgi:hypothetical protein
VTVPAFGLLISPVKVEPGGAVPQATVRVAGVTVADAVTVPGVAQMRR